VSVLDVGFDGAVTFASVIVNITLPNAGEQRCEVLDHVTIVFADRSTETTHGRAGVRL